MTAHDTEILLTQCHKCAKPLGQESRDMGYIICHECRKCDVCNEDVSPAEVEALTSYKHIIRHSTCSLAEMVKENGGNWEQFNPTQYQLNVLNLATLINPNMNLTPEGNKSIIDINIDKVIGGLPHEVTLRIIQNMINATSAIRGALRKATNKTKDQLEEEYRVKDLQRENKRKESEKQYQHKQETKKEEKIKELKEQGPSSKLSYHVRQTNREKFFELLGMPDNADNAKHWDNFILVLKSVNLVKKKEDANRLEFTDQAFERGFKLLRDMGFIN